MKPGLPPPLALLLFWAPLSVCGCRHLQYQLLEPAASVQPIRNQTVQVMEPPLVYEFFRKGSRLAVRIQNESPDLITLSADQSYVIDPRGESHPLPGSVLGPHSHIRLLLPPEPGSATAYQMAPHFGFGYGVPGVPYSYMGGTYGAPYSFSYQFHTPYDWEWGRGLATFLFSYQQNGTNFQHRFVLDRRKGR